MRKNIKRENGEDGVVGKCDTDRLSAMGQLVRYPEESGSGGGIVPGRSTGCYGYCLERL